MEKTVIINEVSLVVEDFQVYRKEKPLKISFQFQVKSEEYHEITTLLYKNDFKVEVPEENLNFDAVISNYSTSITNLYEENNVGEFRLELMEKE